MRARVRGLLALSIGIAINSAVVIQDKPSGGPTPSTPGAEVYFINLKDGTSIAPKDTIHFGLRGVVVAPAGSDKETSGHLHLLIDTGLPSLSEPIPSDLNNLHFAAGQTAAEVILSPGPHTLQLVLADKNHIPHSPPVMSERIHVVVEQPSAQTSAAPGGQPVALVPGRESKKVKVSSGPGDSNIISQRAYELAERVGTRAAWEFLAAHSTGLYADLARAQLDKLNAVQAAEKQAKERAERELADRLARQRQEEEQAKAEAERRQAEEAAVLEAERRALERQVQEREKAEAERHEMERAAALQAERLALQRQEEERRREMEAEAERHQLRREAALHPAETPDPRQQSQACRHDAERLERLRANPAPVEVARFAQEIVCEELRPQVLHLLDSLTPGVTAATQTEHRATEREAAVPQPNTGPDPKRQDLACKREEEQLVRLRADRVRDDVVRFAGDLACERLRPQVQRLLESLGG